MVRASIAAFDLDGTLLKGQSGTLVLKYLARRRLVSPKTALLATWWGIRYKLHLPFRQNEVRERIFKDLSCYTAERVREIMEDFHRDVMVPRYRAEGVAELRRREEAGDHVIIISATFDQIAQAARSYLECDAALATLMRRDAAGRFTGEVDGATTAGPEKVRRIRAWADERFGPDGWELVAAYGDHHSDVPMLEAATTCYAVNPGPTLRREAERRSWKVLAWR